VLSIGIALHRGPDEGGSGVPRPSLHRLCHILAVAPLYPCGAQLPAAAARQQQYCRFHLPQRALCLQAAEFAELLRGFEWAADRMRALRPSDPRPLLLRAQVLQKGRGDLQAAYAAVEQALRAAAACGSDFWTVIAATCAQLALQLVPRGPGSCSLSPHARAMLRQQRVQEVVRAQALASAALHRASKVLPQLDVLDMRRAKTGLDITVRFVLHGQKPSPAELEQTCRGIGLYGLALTCDGCGGYSVGLKRCGGCKRVAYCR
jgi:hypothetical protein